ncbi:ABC transporter ATP-binding protein [Haladaptatus sp. NG-SE-30]
MNDRPKSDIDEENEVIDRTDSEREREAEEREKDFEETRSEVLTVENLGHSFGEVDVFSELSFSVEAGTVTALVGPNGSGKTTLLRGILGLMRPDKGRVTLANSSDDGRRVGYLPQNPAFRPAFTVSETLQFYADLLNREVDVSAVLERVGLSQATDRRVDALSGGMTRLLGVGQAILGDPPLVVLDEPTGDLDPRMTEYIFKLVGDLADAGMAVLLATHNLTGAEEADTVLLLDHGDVVAEGSPADFVNRADTDTFREAFLALTGGTSVEDGVSGEGSAGCESGAASATTAHQNGEQGTPTVSVRTGDDER